MPRRQTRRADNTRPMIASCTHCGEFFDPDESLPENTCPTCADALYTRCDGCGSIVLSDESTSTVEGTTYCSRCLTNTYVCDDCREVHDRGQAAPELNHYNDTICPDCIEARYSRCDICGAYHLDDDLIITDDAAECYRCHDNIHSHGIQSYYFKPAPRFHRMEKEPENSLVLGIELEMDSRKWVDCEDIVSRIENRYDNSWFYFKKDGSLTHGIELVTHPMSPYFLDSKDGRDMWQTVTEMALAGGLRSHDVDTCGLHIHINRDFLGNSETIRTLNEYKLLRLVDRFFEPLAIFSRRKRHELDQWASRFETPKSDDGVIAKARVTSSHSKGTRYHALNTSNDHTLEFRLFKGTLKVETLMATFQLVSGMCHYAKDTLPSAVEKINWYELCDEIIKHCPVPTDELEAYLIERELMTEGE